MQSWGVLYGYAAKCQVWGLAVVWALPLHLAWREGLPTLLILCHKCQSRKLHQDHLCLIGPPIQWDTEAHWMLNTNWHTNTVPYPAQVKMSICKNYVIFCHCQDNMEMECMCSVRRWVNSSLLFTLLTSWPGCEGWVQRWVEYRQGHCLTCSI